MLKRLWFCFILGSAALLGSCGERSRVTAPRQISFAEGKFSIEFPAGWRQNTAKNPYDIQYEAANGEMNTGIFYYYQEDLSAAFTAEGLLKKHVQDINGKRKNVASVEPLKLTKINGNAAASRVIAAERGSSRYYYRFEVLDFTPAKKGAVVLLQVSMPSSWRQNGPILKKLSRTVKLADYTL